jgi:hypothetical protein
MRLSELIEILQDIADVQEGADPEVRLAHQPRWPFEHSIDQVIAMPAADDDDEGEPADPDAAPADVVVYIAEGAQLGYLPGAPARELGWGR